MEIKNIILYYYYGFVFLFYLMLFYLILNKKKNIFFKNYKDKIKISSLYKNFFRINHKKIPFEDKEFVWFYEYYYYFLLINNKLNKLKYFINKKVTKYLGLFNNFYHNIFIINKLPFVIFLLLILIKNIFGINNDLLITSFFAIVISLIVGYSKNKNNYKDIYKYLSFIIINTRRIRFITWKEKIDLEDDLHTQQISFDQYENLITSLKSIKKYIKKLKKYKEDISKFNENITHDGHDNSNTYYCYLKDISNSIKTIFYKINSNKGYIQSQKNPNIVISTNNRYGLLPSSDILNINFDLISQISNIVYCVEYYKSKKDSIYSLFQKFNYYRNDNVMLKKDYEPHYI